MMHQNYERILYYNYRHQSYCYETTPPAYTPTPGLALLLRSECLILPQLPPHTVTPVGEDQVVGTCGRKPVPFLGNDVAIVLVRGSLLCCCAVVLL